MGLVKQHGFVPMLIIIILAVAALGGYFVYQRSLTSLTSPTPKACTQEAKLCPDGSSVGRTGPTCEFSPCPTPDETANWKTYTNTKYRYSIKYPPSWSLVELSSESIDIYDQPNIAQPQLHDGTQVSIFTSDKWEGVQIDDPIGTSSNLIEGVFRKKVADTQLNNHPAAKIVQTVSQSPTDARPTIFIVSKLDNNFFILSFSSITQEQLDKDTGIFNQILSTLRFD